MCKLIISQIQLNQNLAVFSWRFATRKFLYAEAVW